MCNCVKEIKFSSIKIVYAWDFTVLVIVGKICVAQIEPSKSQYNCNVRSDRVRTDCEQNCESQIEDSEL